MRITYYTQEDGIITRTADIPARARLNIRVNDSAGENHQLSCRVELVAGPGIVAERPMYFTYGGAWDGGHCTLGSRR